MHMPSKDMSIHHSFIHKSPKLKITEMTVTRKTNKLWYIYTMEYKKKKKSTRKRRGKFSFCFMLIYVLKPQVYFQ